MFVHGIAPRRLTPATFTGLALGIVPAFFSLAQEAANAILR